MFLDEVSERQEKVSWDWIREVPFIVHRGIFGLQRCEFDQVLGHISNDELFWPDKPSSLEIDESHIAWAILQSQWSQRNVEMVEEVSDDREVGEGLHSGIVSQ